MANSKRRCKYCKEYFDASSAVKVPAGTFCGIGHASAWARSKAAEKQKRERVQKKSADLVRVASLSEICSKAKDDVNAMIRAVDIARGLPCIATGGQISDAGHFYHAGSKYRTSWLRFHHANIHGQAANSNRYAGGGDAINYLAGLLDRYGQTYVDELSEFKRATDAGEMPTPTKQEVIAMAAWCRAMTRLYKKMKKSDFIC